MTGGNGYVKARSSYVPHALKDGVSFSPIEKSPALMACWEKRVDWLRRHIIIIHEHCLDQKLLLRRFDRLGYNDLNSGGRVLRL